MRVRKHDIKTPTTAMANLAGGRFVVPRALAS